MATGFDNIASGNYSTAFGIQNTASGNSSTASGYGNKAIGFGSVAIGSHNKVEGEVSVALGEQNDVSGHRAVAIGKFASAEGINSIAIGFAVRSRGLSSLATGYDTDASGHYSTAMGHDVSTDGKVGAFMIGDKSSGAHVDSSAPNKFTARFANGYLLYTSADLSDFVALGPGGNAWITSSDSTRKTNFVAADGEQFLQKLRGLRLGSWNYKNQEAGTMRHYGPMAQDFFSAYGKDALGTIGNDTTLNAADVDGVAFVLLQALEKRTTELTKEVELLKKQLAAASIRDNRQSEESKRKALVSK